MQLQLLLLPALVQLVPLELIAPLVALPVLVVLLVPTAHPSVLRLYLFVSPVLLVLLVALSARQVLLLV